MKKSDYLGISTQRHPSRFRSDENRVEANSEYKNLRTLVTPLEIRLFISRNTKRRKITSNNY